MGESKNMTLTEDLLCRAFAEKVRGSREFLEWVISQTKFIEHQSRSRLLYEEQVRSRPHVLPENWWRHWWCRIPSTGREGETDIFLVFGDTGTGTRFALHIENKKNSEFLDGQSEGYEIRARLKMNDPKWLNYSDFETVLIASAAYRELRHTSCEPFNRFLSYEDIALFVPEFGLEMDGDLSQSLHVEQPSAISAARSQLIQWKQDADWTACIERIQRYYRLRRDLKFGARRAFPVIGFLCAHGSVTQDKLMNEFSLTKDDAATILANVTMAIQRKGSVWPPASGGWYTTMQKPHTYIVAPGFVAAWKHSLAE
jgi:hypothetical protein